MLSRIFVERPIFAWVIAIVIMLTGVVSIFTLPVEQYPDVAPPQVTIRATYPGASAETLENSVTQIIEQQLTGIDGLLYFSSTSSSRGSASITATFEKGTDPDIAQVQVQNRVQQATSRLPSTVQQQGLTVTKGNPDFLLVVGVFDTTRKLTNDDVSNYLVSNLQDSIGRLPGVGSTNVFGSQYAMRIWLNPQRLASYSLNPSDVVSAIQSQNTEVAAGEIGGQPMPADQMLTATVTSLSRMQTPEEFSRIVVKAQSDGALVRLSDVARVEIGSENYGQLGFVNGYPGSGMAISLAPGADALETADRVKAEIELRSQEFPEGMSYEYPNDTTSFIRLSVVEVIKTLAEAIVLVIIVMFVFLQSWRATLIPAIAVPVVLLGTIAILGMAGFSINTLTLFGMVLAIGLLVDDAIVVVENVVRLMAENPGMSPREATLRSMKEIQVALIAIALVLSAVFLPMAFFGGSTGVIYRQFSLTVISAMVLSVIVALVLSPALTATLLKTPSIELVEENRSVASSSRFHQILDQAHLRFDRWFTDTAERYQRAVSFTFGHKQWMLAAYGASAILLGVLFLRLPTGFLPTEDQGGVVMQFQLPPGAVRGRTAEVQKVIERFFLEQEGKNVKAIITVSGGGGPAAGGGQNTGNGFIALKDWSERDGPENTAIAVSQRASAALSNLRDANVFALVPGPIMGLGLAGGFTLELQNSGGMSRQEFKTARDEIIAAARGDAALAQIRASETDDAASLHVAIDRDKLQPLGITESSVNDTLSIAWGGRYVNDFINDGRVKRVYVQGDAPYRDAPEDLDVWHVRAAQGQMAPFSAFADIDWSTSPPSLSRFSGVASYQIQGQAAPGVSSGEAMDRIEQLAMQHPGVSVGWSGLSFQERLASGQAPLLYGLALLVVFLCLAALYESWSIPVAVLLIVPLGLVGAVIAVSLRGLENDIYLKIGLLTTMGLAAKNAILMIEFAEHSERQGHDVIASALEAARIRLRPILMTSLAFMFGVMPLALSSGAGANSRIAIGTAVVGGVLTATLLAIFYIPLFFVIIRLATRRLMTFTGRLP